MNMDQQIIPAYLLIHTFGDHTYSDPNNVQPSQICDAGLKEINGNLHL